jgi:exopolysaccharide biosynthesis WecB/TagA/CpsF family protein
VLVGATAEQAASLRSRYRLGDLRHYSPPMGFISDPIEVERCVAFVNQQSPFRYCFIAVGSPQQEALAYALSQRRRARGLALCVGASINFLTGTEVRAPGWMQTLSLEWLFRLLQNPRRMASRYLVRGPRVFPIILNGSVVVRAYKPVRGDRQPEVPMPGRRDVRAVEPRVMY